MVGVLEEAGDWAKAGAAQAIINKARRAFGEAGMGGCSFVVDGSIPSGRRGAPSILNRDCNTIQRPQDRAQKASLPISQEGLVPIRCSMAGPRNCASVVGGGSDTAGIAVDRSTDDD